MTESGATWTTCGSAQREGSPPPRCAGDGHEQLPAAVIGTLDDGGQVSAQVPYCADCAQVLVDADVFHVSEVIDVDAWVATVCRHCRGTGRVRRAQAVGSGPSLPRPVGAGLGGLRAVIAEIDGAAANKQDRGFYQNAYGKLRRAVILATADLQGS